MMRCYLKLSGEGPCRYTGSNSPSTTVLWRIRDAMREYFMVIETMGSGRMRRMQMERPVAKYA